MKEASLTSIFINVEVKLMRLPTNTTGPTKANMAIKATGPTN